MPYKQVFVKPEVLLRRNGIVVYCMYKHDDIENHPASTYYFTTNIHASYDDASEAEGVYDIRKLDIKGELEASKPVYMTDSLGEGQKNPAWTNASAEERAKIKEAWELWHDKTEIKVIKKIVRAAIDSGRIIPWVEEQ